MGYKIITVKPKWVENDIDNKNIGCNMINKM